MSNGAATADLLDLIRQRHSTRVPFDPACKVPDIALRRILEAACWSPTAHNMQNFEIVVVDDPARLAALGAVESPLSPVFLRENFRQLSFSEAELKQRKVGVLATIFPPPWREPGADFDAVVAAGPPQKLAASMQGCPLLLIVLHDSNKRAPASEGDILGFMSLGCVMQNMWLAAQSLGIGLQILSVFSGDAVEREVRRLLNVPAPWKIAYACRLGYPVRPPHSALRVRRDVADFLHRNTFGTKG